MATQLHSIHSTPLSDIQYSDAIINIRDLRLRTYIGFNPDEIAKQQDIIVNAEIHYDASEACKTDDASTALNYKTITKAIIDYVEHGQFKLLEKLTGDLLNIAMSDPLANYARVTVDKPHALRFSDSVSVTLQANRQLSR